MLFLCDQLMLSPEPAGQIDLSNVSSNRTGYLKEIRIQTVAERSIQKVW